ncbi:MAG: methionyl-tRNA formyltransferase [Gammaproteobacteria bacterium]|nr:MAG: methionyl-tRNA formyltransferase [Gammaproteobacteria bacterium]
MNPPPLKVIFAGTPDFAAAHLQALIDSKHQLCAVYTQPDRPAGRGQKLMASPVKQLALEQGLPVYQPQSLKTPEARQQLQDLDADIMVVVAYGIILPADILDIPPLGCINVHGSLLPRWRGAAPIQRAIEAGDDKTGVTIMQMDEGLDTGPMLIRSEIPINADDTSNSLYQNLMAKGAQTLVTALDKLAMKELHPTPQDDSKACYAKKLSKAEAAIDWSESAIQIDRKIRAFNPWPGCYVSLDGQKMKIIAEPFSAEPFSAEPVRNNQPGEIISADKSGLRVACGDASLLITSLQMPGKKMTPIAALLNSYQDRFEPGLCFDQ